MPGENRTKHIQGGTWNTVEWFWNTTGTGYFLEPAGAKIRLETGLGITTTSQEQTLDGRDPKRLEVGGSSLFFSRMQVRTQHDTDVTYSVRPGTTGETRPPHPAPN